MPFFRKINRKPAAECGSNRIFVTTRSGIKIWLDPYSEDNSGPVCLDVPSGRKFMRKVMARYQVLEQKKKFVDITQVRSMVKYMASVREQHGMKFAKAVRLLAAQMMNGFEVVSLDRGSAHEQLKVLGVDLSIDGRDVTVRDLVGEFKYRDDYYFTATKYVLLGVLKKYDIKLTLVDQRDRNSVMKIFGDKSDEILVENFSSGAYKSNRITKLWGGLNMENARPAVFREDVGLVGRDIKIVKRTKVVVDWEKAKSREDWLVVFENILTHNFDKKRTEQVKALMDKGKFKRVRNRLRRMGAFEIMHPCKILAEYIYDALLIEIDYDPATWVSFVVRGCNNLLRYQGDRIQQLSHACDELSSVSTESSGFCSEIPGS